ncbi:MAG: hypothetical protein ACOC1F_11150, partial [Myxococcota bacterium]
PASACTDDSTLQVFAASGVCQGGECVYDGEATVCASGCEDGSCVGEPCAGITCDDPPSPCHADTGGCEDGVCSYEVVAGKACDDGDPCTNGDVCSASGNCGGSALTCESPPAPECKDAATLTAYGSAGTCDAAGQCVYEPSEVPCPHGCANGACHADPCEGVVCDSPDPPECVDADTLRVWASPGQCADGVCSYEPSEELCSAGCENGACREDAFTLGSCDGAAMTAAEALALLGSDARVVLASATIQKRTRSCATCAWGDGADWIIHYLTWSGGVTTRYKDLPATMHLVLFNDNGTPRFSIQHTTFAGSTYDDGDGMVYGMVPQMIPYAHVRAYNHAPETQYDYIELDYMVKDATVVLGDGCLQWVADPYGVGGPPYTTGYGVIFNWN